MNKIRNKSVFAIFWNILLLVLLYFQTDILFKIIKNEVFLKLKSMENFTNESFLNFMKERLTAGAVIIIVFILVEIIIFFVGNFMFSGYFKKISRNTEFSEKSGVKDINFLHKYYKYLNLFMFLMIIILILIIIFFSFRIIDLSKSIDLSSNSQVNKDIHEIISNSKVEKISDIKNLLEEIINHLKTGNIYKLATSILDSLKSLSLFKKVWYFLMYVILIFGALINIKFIAKYKKIR